MRPLEAQAHAVDRIAATIAGSRPLTDAERQDLREHPYIVSSDLVRWIVDNRDTLMDTERSGFFDELELQLSKGTDAVRELITEGILEDLQTLSLNKGIDEQAWTRHLGPRTLERWRLIKGMWAGEVPPEEYRRLMRT